MCVFFFKMDGYPHHWMFDCHQEECMRATLSRRVYQEVSGKGKGQWLDSILLFL